MFEAGYDAAGAVPRLGGVAELGEQLLLLAAVAPDCLGSARRHPGLLADPFAFSQPSDVADIMALAPAQHPVAAEAAVGAQDDMDIRPGASACWVPRIASVCAVASSQR